MPDAHPHPATQPTTTAGTPALVMPVLALLQLRRMMLAEGWQVDLQRLCTDGAYAQLCLANAHTSSDARLRRAALALFDACGSQMAPPALH